VAQLGRSDPARRPSPSPRAPSGSATGPTAAVRGAVIAQLVALAGTASLLALGPLPEHWRSGERLLAPTASVPGGLLGMWHGWARAMPVGDLWGRMDLLPIPLLLLLAMVTTRAAYLLFRGPGRTAAAAAAGPLAALPVAAWVQTTGVGPALDPLAAAIFTTLSLTAIVRCRVQLGGITPVAATRALAAATTVALFSPRTAAVLVPIVLVATLLGAHRLRRRGIDLPGRRLATAMLAGTALPGLAVLAIAILVPSPEPLSPASLHLRAGLPGALVPTMPAVLVHGGLTLLVLLAFVLRWRGGALLLVWTGTALWLADAHGPVVAPPVLLSTLAIAVAGWAWLAGTPLRHRPLPGALVAGTIAAALVISLSSSASPRAWLQRPTALAALRPTASLVDVAARGLVAPRDVVLIHDAWLAEAMADRRVVEGWRPDVALHDARDIDHERFAKIALDARDDQRRLLSDSFDIGGRWRPDWALDSGPLFWFVGPMDDEEPDFTDLSEIVPPPEELPKDTAASWIRLQVERARFRRARGAPDAALAALPLTPARHRGLLTRLQLSRSARAEPGSGSELDPWTPPDPSPELLAGWVAAEAGDLLFSHGEQERATELFAEAANAGWVPAWTALVRWQIRAGLDAAATQTLDAMVKDDALHPEVIEVAWWMLRRDRARDARALLDRLPPGSAGERELALRLALLRDATPDEPPPADPADTPTIGRAE
jgi:hypothetical protein